MGRRTVTSSRATLRFKLLRRLLAAAGDPDREFLREAEEGLPVGLRHRGRRMSLRNSYVGLWIINLGNQG